MKQILYIIWACFRNGQTQCSSRCGTAERGVPSGAILLGLEEFHGKNGIKKNQITPDSPKHENGLAQMITVSDSILLKRVNVHSSSIM